MKPIEKRRNEILRPSERNSPYGVEMVFNCGSEGAVRFEKGNEQRSYIFLVTAYPWIVGNKAYLTDGKTCNTHLPHSV